MQVEVVDVLRGQARRVQGLGHGGAGALAARVGGGLVVAVAGEAVAAQLGEDAGAPGGRAVRRLQDHEPGPLPEGQARGRGHRRARLRVERAQGAEPVRRERGERIDAAADDVVDVPLPQQLGRVAEGHGAGRAGVGQDHPRAAQVELRGDVVADAGQLDGGRPLRVEPALVDEVGVDALQCRHGAEAGADHDRDPVPVDGVQVESAALQGLPDGGGGEAVAAVHVGRLLAGDHAAHSVSSSEVSMRVLVRMPEVPAAMDDQPFSTSSPAPVISPRPVSAILGVDIRRSGW